MFSILCGWFVLLAIVAACSTLTIKFTRGFFSQYEGHLSDQFWLSFGVQLLILQYLSLFLPISGAVLLALSTVALICGFLYRQDLVRNLRRIVFVLRDRKIAAGFLLLIFLALWSAALPVQIFDTFLYHYNAVRWATDYAVVPGLANVHFRFGFNSTFHLFAALIDHGIWRHGSAHVAVSFLMIAFQIDLVANLLDKTKPIYFKICAAFILILMVLRTWAVDLNSLTQDLPATIIVAKTFLLWLENRDHKNDVLIALLSCVAISIKMTSDYIGLLVAMNWVFAIYQWKRDDSPSAKRSVRNVPVIVLLYLTGYFIRNLVISGYVLFPFPIPGFGFDWTVPEAFRNWLIDEHKRMNGGVNGDLTKHIPRVIEALKWVPLYTLDLLGALAGSLILRKQGLSAKKYWAMVAFFLGGVFFWIFFFPDPRFGEGFIFSLHAICYLPLGLLIYRWRPKLWLAVALPAFVSVFYIDRIITGFVFDDIKFRLRHRPMIIGLANGTDYSVRSHENLPEGYVQDMYVPANENRMLNCCGESNLPCFAEYRVAKWRKQGDIQSGFIFESAASEESKKLKQQWVTP